MESYNSEKSELKSKTKLIREREDPERITFETCDLSTLLGSLYGLNESQILLFSKILKYPNICIHFLEFMTELKNNAIQKNLKVLLDKGLIERKSVSLAEFKARCMNQETRGFRLPVDIKNDRGYLYLYKIKPISALYEQFKQRLKYIESQLSEFKNLFQTED